eukprot:GHVU01100895.1.p1 GENE.GHVU01100895.1~~GHVU01100895.1.p1  ORF type:complete len:317 (+),score=16.79 GHVU01100895.1:384-1334(+)
MAGQLFTDTGSGYMTTETLSDELRNDLQPKSRFRQFCDVEAAIGKNAGETFSWNVYGDTASDAVALQENEEVPTTSFGVTQGSVTMTEVAIAVPYSGKLEDLSEHDLKKIIHKTLKNSAARSMDTLAHAQFDSAILNYVGTSTSGYNLDTDGTPTGNNNSALNLYHIKTISDLMNERNIPVFNGSDYYCIARPSTMRPFRNELEPYHVYTNEGWDRVVNGETGRYEGIRFVQQTHIAAETNWTTNGLSDAAYFCGADTVTEAVAVPEEIRAKIPGDYGRSKGIAWYYLGGFGITHADTTSTATKNQARILKWDTVA